jgi:hypothetical protein
MIDRRELLTFAGVLGGLAAHPDNAEAAAVGNGQLTERNAQDIVTALKNITSALNAAQSFDAIIPVRQRQVEYLKANTKFPDFIDVSADVWMAVYDWHVRMQQPIVLGRDPVGRYTMLLSFTQLVLRPDVTPNFISVPYDAR